MNGSIRMAALLLGGAVFVGCSKSDTTTPPPTPPTANQTVTPPTTPDMSKTQSAINSAIDKGSNAVKTEADKLPTTLPTLPK